MRLIDDKESIDMIEATRDESQRIAVFSPDSAYRYYLSITWSAGQMINFLMLNPSTADEHQNDPTIERCERRARMWGYGGMIATNLFAFRATDPAVMLKAAEPIGDRNDHYIQFAASRSALTVAAWGRHGKHRNRSTVVRRDVLRDVRLKCLKQTTGEPWHPLYLSYDLTPIDLR